MSTTATRQLGDLREEWDGLVSACMLPSPFLRSWWLAHAATGEPVIVLVHDGDRLLGGAAFERDAVGAGPVRIERIRSLGQGELAPDHLDVVAAPEHARTVTAEVLAWIRRPGQRVVDLDGLAADGSLAHVLGRHEIDRIGAPFAQILERPDPGDAGDDPAEAPPGAGAYLAARPGRLRSTVTRTAKRLTKDGATVAAVDATDPAEVRRALRELARLHDHRWEDASGFLGAWSRFERAAVDGCAAGDVRIGEVRTEDGTVVATELDLLATERIAFYQAGRSTDRQWRGAGSVLRSEIIAAAAAEGRGEYDLLRGDETYKSEWATGRRELIRVRFGVGTAGGAVATGARLWRDWQQRSTDEPT